MAAVVCLVRAMRSGGPPVVAALTFLGLTGTMLSDEAARLHAEALNNALARVSSAKAETVEILQVALGEPV